jgi:glutamyl-Q tRNA(Asp) synthetase
MSIVTRFAPSPTGYLHLGHAFAAITAWRRARDRGGQFLLRLEDIDTVRCRESFAVAIEEDLRWLGLDWDGPVRVQSAHFSAYRAELGRLPAELSYPCFCSRADIRREVAASASAPHAPDGAPVYPGICRGLSADERAARIAAGAPYAIRLNMRRAVDAVQGRLEVEEETVGRVVCEPGAFGDVVLARRDVPASYHLCVTHDDAVQGITLVTRAKDLLPATHLHRLLQALLGYPTPAYAHHELLTGAAGRRLSKRDGAPTLRDLRTQGFTPSQVRIMAECRA